MAVVHSGAADLGAAGFRAALSAVLFPEFRCEILLISHSQASLMAILHLATYCEIIIWLLAVISVVLIVQPPILFSTLAWNTR